MNKIMKKRAKRIQALALAAFMTGSMIPASLLGEANAAGLTLEDTASITSVEQDSSTVHFSWDNVTSYFVLTDRFVNGDSSNDNSYGRGLDQNGNTQEGLDYTTNPGTFHGGDLKGLTQTVEEGYFTDLGVNAIWITAPYEQIHGFTSGNVNGDSATSSNGNGFPYYSYHGYWALDYTNVDANMGTAEDLKKFVDSCHERGIRVIMDVVLNHVGYATIKDLEDADMDDALNAGASDYYYGNVADLTGGMAESETWYNLSSSDWAKKWWGADFVRVASDYAGYSNVGKSAGLTSTLCGLPDVITEGTSNVDLPPILANKWKEEKRYAQEVAELDSFFNETGYTRSASNYIIKWLTDYVREYGIDGFRCDTAAHVELASWNRLHEQGVKALNEWRENNQDAPGADWTDDFWMTGESWGHGQYKDGYYSEGGFDSMINFAFPKNGNLSNIESVYSSYASSINSDEDYNVLSYLTSHDDTAGKGLFGTDNATNMNAGTSLLLSPGGVQIFYGNETNRGLAYTDFFTGGDYTDQVLRSDMNWNSYDETVLAHWQKVGQFRNNHVSVGAGDHQQLDGDVYTFARTYNLEEEDEDKVVVALPQAAGTFTVSVGDVFDDGEVVTDFYSGKSYTVSGGEVEATTTSATDPILLQGSGIVKPSVNAKTKVTASAYKPETFEVTLKANRVTNATYSIDGATPVAYEAGDVITLGGGTAYGESTTLKVSGISEDDGSVVTKTFTYTRQNEPNVSDGYCVKVKKSDVSSAPYIFVYTNDANETALAGAWPGTQMTEDPTDSNYWIYENEEIDSETSTRIILSSGSWRSTADMQPGIVVSGAVEYDKSSNKVSEIPHGVPGLLVVRYEREDGALLKKITRVGAVGRNYTTSAATIKGATLKTVPTDAAGTFTESSTVTYTYVGGTPIVDEPIDVAKFAVKSVTADVDGTNAVITVNATKKTGSLKYMFTYEDAEEGEVLLSNFSDSNVYTWENAPKGTVTVTAYVINNGNILSDTVSFDVDNKEEHTEHTYGAWESDYPTSIYRECSVCGEKEAYQNPYTDVKTASFFKPILWASYNEITKGTGTTFNPNKVATRGQVVTFIWRSLGCPEPKSTNISFSDVSSSSAFSKAITWAAENGITTGAGGKFYLNKECTRAEVVTFLWRAAGSPEPKTSVNPFSDVKTGSTFYKAILWASENGITSGTGSKFNPNNTCTRAQIVTFLYRYVEEYSK